MHNEKQVSCVAAEIEWFLYSICALIVFQIHLSAFKQVKWCLKDVLPIIPGSDAGSPQQKRKYQSTVFFFKENVIPSVTSEWSRHMLVLHFPVRAALLLYVRQISVLLASPQMCIFCHLLEKGLTTIYSGDSSQILFKDSVIALFNECLKLLFHHGDLLCEMFPSMQGSYLLELLKAEEKQNKMLPLTSCMQIFISSELK